MGSVRTSYFMRHLADLRKWLLAIALVVPALAGSAVAQVNQFLPEIDAYYKVADELRVWTEAKETYEAGDPVAAEFGPSLDFYLKPMVRLENITTFDLDDSKSRLLTFSIGYRYLPTPALRRPIAWSLSSRSTSLCQNSGSCSRSQPRRPRLAEWRLYLALPESLAAGTQRENPLLPFAALRQR